MIPLVTHIGSNDFFLWSVLDGFSVTLVPVKDRFLVRGEEILTTLEERTSPLVVTILPTRPTLGLPRDRENVIPDDPTGSGVVSEDPTGSTLVGAGGVGGCHSEC